MKIMYVIIIIQSLVYKTTVNIVQVINDTIHGPIVLSPLQFQIINTCEFHRLKDLRQLGKSSIKNVSN